MSSEAPGIFQSSPVAMTKAIVTEQRVGKPPRPRKFLGDGRGYTSEPF